MITLTKYGREAVWIATTALLFVLGGKKGRRAAALLFIVFVILIPLGTALKDEINRPRPMPLSHDNLLVKEESDSSFSLRSCSDCFCWCVHHACQIQPKKTDHNR